MAQGEHAEPWGAEPTGRPSRGQRRSQTSWINSFPSDQRAAVYRVIDERRDVRRGFRPDPIPAEVLERVLAAAHRAPSVGFSQPWDFILITDPARRARIKALAERSRDDFAAGLPGARARAFDRLKTEAILQTPVNVVVTCDPTRGGRHTLGRHAQPQTAVYSSVLAVANLWLAARAEGLGVGWVSFFSERELAAELGLPSHLEVVAYLCIGYVSSFAPEPELELAGGPAAARSAGPCTPRNTGAGSCPAVRLSACSTRSSRRSGRLTPTPWRPPGNGRRR